MLLNTYSQKVDFHSHYLPPAYYEYLDKYEYPMPDTFKTPKWSLDSHLREMDRLGVAFSLMSISSPDLCESPDAQTAARYARRINEEGAQYVKDNPDKLGFAAELPLPYIDEAISEAVYALDVLKADCVGLKTNYKKVYLGSPDLAPLMKELNARNATVIIHPTRPSRLPEGVNHNVPIPAMEYFFETTRVFANMESNNTFMKYPNIKWIFPHAGAFISILCDRFSNFKIFTKRFYKNSPLKVYSDLKHVYFDLAGFPLPKQLQILRKNVPISHMVYGSDCPYTPEPVCLATTGQLEITSQLTNKEKKMIFTKNAYDLIPRLSEIKLASNNDSLRSAPKPAIHKGIRHFTARCMDIYMLAKS